MSSLPMSSDESHVTRPETFTAVTLSGMMNAMELSGREPRKAGKEQAQHTERTKTSAATSCSKSYRPVKQAP